MMISLPSFIVPETANVGLHATLLVNLNSNNLDLVVSEANFDFEHIGHHKLISLDRVKVMFLLFPGTSRLLHLTWDMYLILLPKY